MDAGFDEFLSKPANGRAASCVASALDPLHQSERSR